MRKAEGKNAQNPGVMTSVKARGNGELQDRFSRGQIPHPHFAVVENGE
jgi:hypothetical protein